MITSTDRLSRLLNAPAGVTIGSRKVGTPIEVARKPQATTVCRQGLLWLQHLPRAPGEQNSRRFNVGRRACWGGVDRLRSLVAPRFEAIVAVDRLAAARYKWHPGFLTTPATGRRVHFADRSASAAKTGAFACASGRFARRSTVGAPVRFVREALLGEKLLFAAGKREDRVAINACQTLVGIHSFFHVR